MLKRRSFTILQMIASAIFSIFVIKTGLLPVKYIILLILILIALVFLLTAMMKPNKRKKREGRHARKVRQKKNGPRQAIGRLLSLALSIVLVAACFYVKKGSQTLATLTSTENTIITRYCVYTLKNKGYDSISDLSNKTIANAGSFDEDDFNTANQALKKKISYTAKAYTSYRQMVDDLYSGRVAGILMNSYYITLMQKYHSSWDNDVSTLWYKDMHETASATSLAKDFTKDTFTIYLSGVDSRSTVTKTSRSDSNIILTVNPSKHQILMTSIPRDYYVNFAMATGAKDKLTHAALFGTINSLKTIENFMNIDIDFYCRVNFQALVKIVDAVDGIKVYSDKAFIPWTNKKVRIKKGWQTMDGETALAFARERHAYSQGDRHRAANQQAVLKALFNKLESSKILTNYSKIMDSITGLFQTDISTSQLTDLINEQLSSGASWDIQSSVLKGNSEKRLGGLLLPHTAIYYMIPDQNSISKNAQYIKNMLAGEKITVDSDSTLASETNNN